MPDGLFDEKIEDGLLHPEFFARILLGEFGGHHIDVSHDFLPQRTARNWPPSTGMTVPVMELPRGDTSSATRLAISLTVPMPPSGPCCSSSLRICSPGLSPSEINN